MNEDDKKALEAMIATWLPPLKQTMHEGRWLGTYNAVLQGLCRLAEWRGWEADPNAKLAEQLTVFESLAAASANRRHGALTVTPAPSFELHCDEDHAHTGQCFRRLP